MQAAALKAADAAADDGAAAVAVAVAEGPPATVHRSAKVTFV
jgi:hypothetical protein